MSIAETNMVSALEHPGLQSVRNTEFINNYYALSQEPMNLRAVGQRWFDTIYRRECSRSHATALVLGGTPWLGALLKAKRKHVVMVDVNPAMLDTAQSEIDGPAGPGGDVEYVCANWLAMPPFSSPIDIVVGDNCLNFLQYPDGWTHFFDNLLPAMSADAQLMIRFIAIPPTHAPMSVDQIVRKYLAGSELNYTQVRAHMLLANWDPALMAIRTEQVADVFEANEAKFNPLFRKFPVPQNDLVTIRKFKNTGFVLMSPPLEEILRFLSTYFRVTSVHFGPYGLSEYFPIIVARCR